MLLVQKLEQNVSLAKNRNKKGLKKQKKKKGRTLLTEAKPHKRNSCK